MAKFKVGELVYVVVSGEQVMVVDTPAEESNPYDIRRGIGSEGRGQQYTNELFDEFELETVTERIERELERAQVDADAFAKYKTIKEKINKNSAAQLDLPLGEEFIQ